MWVTVFVILVTIAAVTITIDLREERRKTEKIAELEAQMKEKTSLIDQLVVLKRGE